MRVQIEVGRLQERDHIDNKRGGGNFLASGRSPVMGQAPRILVHVAHTRQARNDLGQNVRAGSPEAAGMTINRVALSQGRGESRSAGSRTTVYRVARAVGSPPRGLAFCFPSSAAQLRKPGPPDARASGCTLYPEVV